MTPNQPDDSNPAFQTPQPAELQSKESRDAVMQRVSEQQNAESDVADDSEAGQSDAADAALLKNIERVEDRHMPRIDSPPG